MKRLRGQSGLSLVAMALLASTCVAQLSAQNAATSVSVDASANHRAINPNIYGVCFAGTADVAALNAPLNRMGGNNMSDYNWQIDALNLDFDWYFESFLQDDPMTPGKAADNFIQNTRAANVGSEPMITIPMLPYIATLGPNATTAAASLWSYSVAKYGAQTGSDPYQPDAGNGISAATGQRIVNDPTDAYVPNSVTIQQAWLQHLLSTWGTSTTTNGVKYYILDNEPSLWNSTHVDVYPNPESYQEEYNNIVTYATAIRAADPNARIVAPEEWIWWAMYVSGLDQKNGTGAGSDYATHNNTYYYPWLLQQLYKYQQTNGTKLIDALSVHCYNPIPGDGDDSTSQATRNRETRILWDANFVDPSWEGTLGINGGIQDWIPTIRNWVNQYYPGLEIGCTEYNWGDESELNGATTQADVLGIYGVYGFDLATRWTVPAQPTYLAMQIYRNYDGNLSTFGDTSVSATVANPDDLSAFAAVRSKDGALTVMVINKQQGSTPVTVSLANFPTTGTAQAYQIASATETSIASLGSVTVANNAISVTVPSQSITLFVIPPGSVTSAPTAPTGLAATVGNRTVTLTWNAGGGATSYTVQRGAASTGPFTAIGTVTSPAPTTFTDTGLTNGTTYYYVVSGTNSIGTSPNSAPVAATPLVPPTFSSSATASPNPVTQNSSTTITATVKCTANTLSNGTVQIIALDPNGNVALTQNSTAQSFTTNQTKTFTAALTPALAGTYTVEIGVFSATGQQWSWNTSAGTITVNSSLAFTSSATAPSTVALGGTASISVTVTETGTSALTNGNVELQIFNTSGTAVATNVWSGQNFSAGQTIPYSYTWSPASGTVATGTYTIDLGVFDSSWSQDYYWNTDATITVTSGPSAPPAPTGLTATAGNTQVSLNWTASSGATSYKVYRGTTAGGESTTAIATGVTTASYSDAGLTNGTKYYYKVAAVNTAGTSALSSEVSATPEPPAPATPAGLTAAAGNASVVLSWTASSGATSYNVYRGTTAGGESATAAASGITTTFYSDTGLSNGTKYYYKVAAVNAGGTSALSVEASATPQASVRSGPPTVDIDSPTSGATVSGSVTVSGWAIDNDATVGTAVGSVRVLVDGTAAGTATYGVSRPDVCAAYPDRPGCPNVGYTYSLNTSALAAGLHTITVTATDSASPPDTGSASVTVIVGSGSAVIPTVHIDSPATGATVSGIVTVSGWAIDNASTVGTAIGSVQVLLDGTLVGTATYGVSRPDVCAAFPGRPGCPNVGYTYSLNTAALTAGSHSITVTAKDSANPPDAGSAKVLFTVGSGAAVIPTVHIDSPAPGATISGTVTVSGWAIDNDATVGTAIGSVRVLVDGTAVGTAIYGVSRPDVCAAYPDRPGCPNVGYTYSLNTAALASGSHTIMVTATDSASPPDSGSAIITVRK